MPRLVLNNLIQQYYDNYYGHFLCKKTLVQYHGIYFLTNSAVVLYHGIFFNTGCAVVLYQGIQFTTGSAVVLYRHYACNTRYFFTLK